MQELGLLSEQDPSAPPPVSDSLYWTEKYNITPSEFKFLSLNELRWLSRFVSSSLTHLFAEFSPTDRGQSLHDASVCLWRATGPNRILYSSVRNLDPDGIWFQTSSLKGHGVIWSLLLRISTVVQSCHSHSALTEQNVFFVFWPHSQWTWLKTQHWWKSKDSL